MASVILRSGSGTICRITCDKQLQRFAMQWSYIVRQRSRWEKNRRARLRQAERAAEELGELKSEPKIRASTLRKIANSGVIEVCIPYEPGREDRYWEGRITPWEHVLTSATRKYRDGDSLVVVRHLSRGGKTSSRQPDSLVIVEAAPGSLRDRYDFEAENELVRGSLRALNAQTVADPTASELSKQLKKQAPDVVHVTGIDTHLGRSILGTESEQSRDGICLSSSSGDGSVEEVGAGALAKLVNSGDPCPQFVGYNVWNSGSRMAPLAVVEGAGAALGFQHTFDDGVAEMFFVNFYRSCIENRWNYLSAFMNAWHSITRYRERIRGSSITLWSAKSLVRNSSYKDLRSSVTSEVGKWSGPTLNAREADPKKDRISDLVRVTTTPRQHLNYSLLHNGDSILEDLTLRFMPRSVGEKDAEESSISHIRNIDVTVTLHAGDSSFPYRTQVRLGEETDRISLANKDLGATSGPHGNPAGGIGLPLTSHLLRSVSERVQTSIFVEVTWHGQVLYRHTHPVWLSPVDQWSLSDDEIHWLPSFVQPRDPAVATIIDSAQKYLKCLADYGPAGFDGYQSFDPDADDPWLGVEHQVQSIWAALVFDYGLAYINPPPSYLDSNQRLRTPGQVMRQKRGTCVDLAILFASCLEWIEIYPVIFMLDDHAFPGYWRDLKAYDEFINLETESTSSMAENSGSQKEGPSFGWISGRSTYKELKHYVEEEMLVPLESVLLTAGSGFSEAVSDGRSYFEKRRNTNFHSMIDILSSREAVTPLPLSIYTPAAQ